MLTNRELIILIENLEKAKIKFEDYSYGVYRLNTIIDTLKYILNPEDKNYGGIIRGVCNENK